MAKFAPGASFAVVTQKDGSFAVEVREPRRVFPLRITGYASEAEATAAIAGFKAIEPLQPASDPVAPVKPTAEVAPAPVETRRQVVATKKRSKPAPKRKRASPGKSRKR